MTTLTCPKCRQGMSDAALDVGACPACGFPIDGPLVLDGASRRRSPALLFVVAGILVVAAGAAGYAYFGQTQTPAPGLADTRNDETPITPVRHVAPFPHTPKPRDPKAPDQTTSLKPADPNGTGDKVQPPVAVVEPKRDGPRPIGVVMKIDPKIAPKRHFDQPDDTAALPDLNSGDRVTLTGRLRVLRVGSVNGKGSLDASGLVAEEIVITGDLNAEAVVTLNAPGGKVTIGGYVGGVSKLTVVAPGGEVVVLADSGRLTGSAVTTVTAKRVEVAGKLLGAARLNATLTTGGSLRLTTTEEGAIVTYKKFASTDPAPVVERGVLRGGAKVLAE